MSSRGSQRQGQDSPPAEVEFRQRLRRAMFSEALVLLAVVGVLVVLISYLQSVNAWLDRTDVVIGRATLVQNLVIDREARLHAYVIAGDRKDLAAYDEADGRLLPAIDGLQELVVDDRSQVARLALVRAAAAKWRERAEQQLARKRAGATAPTLTLNLAAGIGASTEARSQLDDFLKVEGALRARRAARVHAVTRYSVLAGAGLVLLLGPALLLATARQMRRVKKAYLEALVDQERATVSLQESEEKLRLAKDAAKMGSWNWNIVSGELVWSERCKALFGLGPDTGMSHERFLAAVHPDDRDRIDRAVKDALANRTAYDAEMRVPWRDGSVRWVATRGQATYGPDGRPIRMMGMTLDITDRKANEERAEWLARFPEENPDPVMRLNAGLAVVYANNAALAQLGPLRLGVGRSAPPELALNARRALREGRVRTQITSGSRTFTMTFAAVGTEVNVYGQDITERLQAEEALRASEERCRALGLASSDVVYRMSADWTEMRQLVGRAFIEDTDAPTGAWLEKYIHPDDQPAVKAAIEHAIRTKSIFQLEHRVLRVDGSLGWTFSRAIPMLGADGSIIEWFGAASDVTARKTAELALERANALMREADIRKDEFLGMLSHELRNPLAPIRSSVHILGRAAPDGEQARRARTVIARQVDHLARLVDDLLDVKRISTGKLRLHRVPMDLKQPVRETVEDLRPLFVKHSVSLDLKLPDQAIWVSGDRTRLAQVLGNLLQNAAKFTNPGGHVSVAVERSEGRASIRVRDDGVGVPPDMIDVLFEPFVQADKTLHRTTGGLGLGLSLVRGIAELHGGTATVRSEGIGKGTEFEVALPMTEPSVAARDEATTAQTGTKCRVLIIEDNVDSAESFGELLQMVGGHEVYLAHDGEAGIAAARQHAPDVIMCDIGLPVMDGYDVARWIRSSGVAPGARLIAVSGYASPDDIDRAIRAGFDYHVAKPPDIDRVLALVAEAPSCRMCAPLPDDLATGHHEVDAQHASILSELERLRVANPEAVWESLRFLQQHTASHFRYEEALMEDVGYPDLAAHEERHESFLHQLSALQERLERHGATHESLGMLADTVGTWVVEHVLDQDRRLAEFIHSQTPERHAAANGAAPAPGVTH